MDGDWENSFKCSLCCTTCTVVCETLQVEEGKMDLGRCQSQLGRIWTRPTGLSLCRNFYAFIKWSLDWILARKSKNFQSPVTYKTWGLVPGNLRVKGKYHYLLFAWLLVNNIGFYQIWVDARSFFLLFLQTNAWQGKIKYKNLCGLYFMFPCYVVFKGTC